MVRYTLVGALLLSATSVLAQTPGGNCTGDSSFCAGGPIILRCTGGKLQPGNCADNLNEPPLGALCVQTSPTAGDAHCEAITSSSAGTTTTHTSTSVTTHTSSEPPAVTTSEAADTTTIDGGSVPSHNLSVSISVPSQTSGGGGGEGGPAEATGLAVSLRVSGTAGFLAGLMAIAAALI